MVDVQRSSYADPRAGLLASLYSTRSSLRCLLFLNFALRRSSIRLKVERINVVVVAAAVVTLPSATSEPARIKPSKRYNYVEKRKGTRSSRNTGLEDDDVCSSSGSRIFITSSAERSSGEMRSSTGPDRPPMKCEMLIFLFPVS